MAESLAAELHNQNSDGVPAAEFLRLHPSGHHVLEHDKVNALELDELLARLTSAEPTVPIDGAPASPARGQAADPFHSTEGDFNG